MQLDRHPRPALRAALLLVALIAPRVRALDVAGLAARVGGRRGDTIRLAGRAHGLSLADADVLLLTVDVLPFQVPIAAGRPNAKTIGFHAPKAEPGLRAFSFNVRSGRFRALLVGVPLSGLPNPFPLRLTAGTTQDCALVRVATSARGRHGKHRDATALQLARSQLVGTCSTIDVVGLDPATVMVGTQTTVAVTAQPPAGVSANSVALYRADESGAPAGSAICVLQDDGSEANGDAVAGDGVFGCLARFTEASAGVIPLLVQADLGGTTIGSTGFELRVAPPLTADDAAQILATQAQAESIWEQNVARDGYTVRTQTETIAAIGALDGVAEVGVGGDGLTIDITYASGVGGSILWAPRFSDEDAVPAAIGRHTAAPVQMATPAVTLAPEKAPERTLIGNRRALLWDTQIYDGSEVDTAEEILAKSLCPYFDRPDITVIKGDAATVDSLANLTQYDTVVLVSHGLVNKKHSTTIMTKELVTAAGMLVHAADLQAGRVRVLNDFKPAYFGVEASYITYLPGRFDHAVVYAGLCSSSQNAGLFTAFAVKGAAAFFGYTAPVGDTFGKSTGAALVTGLVKKRQTALMAYGALPTLVDPNVSLAVEKKGKAARITLTLAPGIQDLAYLDLPTLMPDAPFLSPSQSIVLTTEMKGSENCDLTYLWHTPAAEGHLHDGIPGHEDNFTSAMKTATYTANADASDTDTVRVSLAPTKQPDDGIGEATATITFGCEVCTRAIAEGAACSCSGVTLDPPATNLLNGRIVTLTPSVSGAIGAGHVIFYRWTNTALYGHVTDGVPGDVDNFTTSIAVNAAYRSNDEGLGTDTITVEAYDGDPAQGGSLLGMASATVSVVLGGGTQFVLNPAALCVPGTVQAGTSCVGFPYNAIFVCTVAGQQAKNGVFYAHPGDSVHIEGYTCGQRCVDYGFSLPSYELFPQQHVCLPSDPPPNVVAKVVDDTALIPYTQFSTGQECCQLAATCFEFVVGSPQEQQCAQMGGTTSVTFCGGNGTCGQY